MICLLHPKNDFSAAADIAVQTLAQPSNEQIYVVPRHNRRSKMEIQESLNKASIALLLAYSVIEIDQDTLSELKFF